MSKFPLPPDYFRCPALSADEITRLQALGERTSTDMVHASRLQGGSITWTLASDIDGLQLYSGNDPSAPRGVTSYVGVTEVMGTLDEVAALFKTDTAEGYHEYLRMFGTDHLDGQTLYTLATESTDRPRHHLSLQWSASAMPGLANPRDWCFLESQHDFTTDHGRPGWVRAFKSVKLTCCPDLQTTFNVVRGEYHRSGYIIMESPTRRGALVAMALHQIDWKGSIPSFATASAVRRRCRAVADLDTHLRSRRLRGLPFLPMHRLVPFALRVKCFVCCARFGVFGYSKESCRQCGEVVCRTCSRQWDVGTHLDKLQVRICAACTSSSTTSTPTTGAAPATTTSALCPGITAASNHARGGRLSSKEMTVVPTGYRFGPPQHPPPSTPISSSQSHQHLIYFPLTPSARSRTRHAREKSFPTPRGLTSEKLPAPPRSTRAREKPQMFQDWDDAIAARQPRSTKARSKPQLHDVLDGHPHRPTKTPTSSRQEQAAPRNWDEYEEERGSIGKKSHLEEDDRGNIPATRALVRVQSTPTTRSRTTTTTTTPRGNFPPSNAHFPGNTPTNGQSNNPYFTPRTNLSRQYTHPLVAAGRMEPSDGKSHHHTPRRSPYDGANFPSRYIAPTDISLTRHQSAGEFSSTSHHHRRHPLSLEHKQHPHRLLKASPNTRPCTPRNDLIMIEDAIAPAGETTLAVVTKGRRRPHACSPAGGMLPRGVGAGTAA